MSWPALPLAEVLTEHREYIDAPDPRLYPKLSVKLYGKGVVLHTPADGATLKMQRHQVARAGQVILSEIWGEPVKATERFARVTSFLFDVRRERLEPRYLQAIFSANYLQEQLDQEAKDTTGYAAVRPRNLLAATIPLPRSTSSGASWRASRS